jgi:hypothetical protein
MRSFGPIMHSDVIIDNFRRSNSPALFARHSINNNPQVILVTLKKKR